MILALLLCTSVAVDPGRDDVAQALARLSSPDSEERRIAEGWLSAHLTLKDYPALAETAAAGDLEVRGRIARALASDDRHLGLCALLCTERATELAALGERAATELFTAWLDSAELEALPREAVKNALNEGFEHSERLAIVQTSLETALDRIARLADPRRTDERDAGNAAIVLDPSWSPATGAGAASRVSVHARGLGPLVLAVAEESGAQVDLYNWGGKHPWILVGAPKTAQAASASSCLVKWLRDAVAGSATPRGAASARALAALGWPASVEWLSRRWSSDARDAAALAGLVLAAGRGRVAPVLATTGSARRLFEMADAHRSRADPESSDRAAEFLRALLAIGGVGLEGEDLAAIAAEGWTRAAPAGRANRRAVFAALGRAPDAIRADARAELATSSDAAERFAAMRMLAATAANPEPQFAVAGPVELVRAAAATGEWTALFDACQRLGIAVSPQWFGSAEPRATELAVLGHWLERESTPATEQACAKIVRKWIQDPASELALGGVLHRAVLGGARAPVERLMSAAAQDGAAVADRVALLAGVLPSAGLERAAAALAARSEWSVADWIVAGAHFAHEGAPKVDMASLTAPEDAHQRLFLERVRASIQRIEAAGSDSTPPELAGLEAGWVRGLERAVTDLRARDEDLAVALVLQMLRQWLQRCPHPLRKELREERWPARSDRDLARFEPWLGR